METNRSNVTMAQTTRLGVWPSKHVEQFIYDENSTPPTGPMVPLTQDQLDNHRHAGGFGILDPGVMPGAPALNY